jgi:glycosyltransferase involved in cell wall biosynthesis
VSDPPKVSAVITSYNHERFLRECIESVLSQTVPPDEILLIDDASSDASPAIAREYEGRIRVMLLDDNVGTYAALNRAIEVASGHRIAILNSDDAWEPRKLEVQTADLGDRRFSFTNGHFVDAMGVPCTYHVFGHTLMRLPSGNALVPLIYHNHCFPSTVMFEKSLWEECGRFREDLQCLGDWDLFLRMAERTEFAFVDEDLVRYRVHEAQTSKVRVERMNREEMDIRHTRVHSREIELMERAADRKAMVRALAHSAAALGTLNHLFGDARTARRWYLHSLRLYPLRGKSLLRLGLALILPRIRTP